MKWQDINANIMSLGGIAIAIGAMVDGAIVMIENAHKHLELETDKKDRPLNIEERWRAIANSAKEVGPALFFSLMIITVSFLPVFTLQAQEGRLFSPLAFTKTYAMAASAILAITLVPVLMGYFIRGKILAENKNIIGIKEASGDLVQAMEVMANTPEEFLLISGDDMLAVPLCSIGAVGLISVLANAYPAIFNKIITSCNSKNYALAAQNAFKILKINNLMYTEGNPVGLKQLLAYLGLCRPNVRLPLVKASSELSENIRTQLL